MEKFFFVFLFWVAIQLENPVYSQKTILLDNYYNNEKHPQTRKSYHYLWSDTEVSGFSEFGKLFEQQGYKLDVLKEKPNRSNLGGSLVYIIVDPDFPQENQSPNYIDRKTANEIATWVKLGGVLLLMSNDVNNCEIDSLNILASLFGIRFNKDVLHSELTMPQGQGRNFNSCASEDLPNHPLFKNVKKIFIKGISSIKCEKQANAILVENGKVLMAESDFGKGKVFAVGDPWLYNEYINHLSLPAEFDNYQAGKNLVNLLLKKK